MSSPSRDAILAALATVHDPELRRPITDLDMVGGIDIAGDGAVVVHVLLTVAGCPLKATLEEGVRQAVGGVDGVTSVAVTMTPMSPAQRDALTAKLRGGAAEPEIPFAKPGSTTRVYAVASGKGGVGKSSITANLAIALAEQGLAVGLIDADIYGFSIPRMLGDEAEPTQVGDMIVPPVAHGVKMISMGMLVPPGRPVVWRGPMLHRVLQQFLTDVFWGDLDVLLLDLPPGTGDVPLSVAQLLPSAELLIVTTPQVAAAEVAQRAGAMALQTHQPIAGVIENMAWLEQPDGTRLEVFGAGGGQAVATNLTQALGQPVELLGQIPLDLDLRAGGDTGNPVVTAVPDSPAATELRRIAERLGKRATSLAGRRLGVSPV
jgi:ATP-binding protein involved in chromosome partitioning